MPVEKLYYEYRNGIRNFTLHLICWIHYYANPIVRALFPAKLKLFNLSGICSQKHVFELDWKAVHLPSGMHDCMGLDFLPHR